MSGILLNRLTTKVRAQLKRTLKGNKTYKKHRWNLVERAQVYCSTHYLKAMFLLWAMAGSAVLIAIGFRAEFSSFAANYLKNVTKLPEWMSNLLGAQLTIIGIVFPLVVGLISVLFQKKYSRIHIQTAYQLHSGYMFAGLSGLSLAAFILISGLFLAAGDKYLDTAFAVTALIWMLFNIVLSIWFFITSLNILDDKKRDHLMLKYFQSQIVENHILRSLKYSWIQYPGSHIGKDYIKGITILPYSVSSEESMGSVKFHIEDHIEISDVYLGPLNFLLHLLKPVQDKNGSIVILPSQAKRDNKITLLSSTDVIIPGGWPFFFRQCFIKGPKINWKEYRHITRDFYGEVYDALEDKNISTFIIATDRLIDTYTTLKKSFRYADGNYIDECHGSGMSLTFSQSFYHDFYSFSNEVVKSLETTGEYFRKIIDVPFSVYRDSDSREIVDFQQCMESLFYVWYVLNNWKRGYAETLSVSQEQRHREVVKDFIGEWESWYMWRRIKGRGENRFDDDSAELLSHLYETARIVMAAVMSDDRYASDHSTDMLLLWFSRNRFEQHFEQYRWHSFFLTPSYLTQASDKPAWQAILRGNAYSEKAAQAIIFFNALTDIRLLTAGYILSHVQQKKNVRLNNVITRLLTSQPVYPTGAHDLMTTSLTSSADIIDIIIRLECRPCDSEDSWYKTMSDLVKAFSSFNETEIISGRIYMGTYEDVRNIYASYADIAFYLSAKFLPVTQRVRMALNDNLFTYHQKEQIIYQLQGFKRREDSPSDGYLMPDKAFKEKIVCFNETLDAYIQAFSRSMHSELLNAEIDTELLKNTDLTLTRELPLMLARDALLSRFSYSTSNSGEIAWTARSVNGGMSKNILARGISSTNSVILTPVSAIKQNLLGDVYHGLSQLQPLRTINVRDEYELLKHLREMTADNEDYTLIFFGTHLGSELREMSYHAERFAELGIILDMKSDLDGLMPVRINNCGIYQVWDNDGGFYSLLVRNNVFGSLHMLSDPDGQPFSTSWHASDEDPLSGWVTTSWKQELGISGSVVARFNHS